MFKRWWPTIRSPFFQGPGLFLAIIAGQNHGWVWAGPAYVMGFVCMLGAVWMDRDMKINTPPCPTCHGRGRIDV